MPELVLIHLAHEPDVDKAFLASPLHLLVRHLRIVPVVIKEREGRARRCRDDPHGLLVTQELEGQQSVLLPQEVPALSVRSRSPQVEDLKAFNIEAAILPGCLA